MIFGTLTWCGQLIKKHMTLSNNKTLQTTAKSYQQSNLQRIREKQDSKCGPTPPCSPVCGAGGGAWGSSGGVAEAEDEEAGPAAAEDNLVWVSVHTRDPQHPHFNDQFNKVRVTF